MDNLWVFSGRKPALGRPRDPRQKKGMLKLVKVVLVDTLSTSINRYIYI